MLLLLHTLSKMKVFLTDFLLLLKMLNSNSLETYGDKPNCRPLAKPAKRVSEKHHKSIKVVTKIFIKERNIFLELA